MADGPTSSFGITGNGFVWLFMLATGTLFLTQAAPLQGSRPATGEPQIHDDRGPQNVEARLWQDPFAAVSKSLKAGEKPAPAGLEDLFSPRAWPLVIGVTVPGSPYVEDAESRRRYRYAVLAGLNVEGYVPADGEHIGYLQPKAREAASLPKFIPFERFESPHRPKVLVLWLDENALSSTPLASLRQLLPPEPVSRSQTAESGPLRQTSARTPNAGSTVEVAPALKIIGPSSSTMLRNIASEVGDKAEAACGQAARSEAASLSFPFEFFDFGATTDDATLGALICPGTSPSADAETLFGKRGLRFHRLTAPDDRLAAALAAELRLREVRPDTSCASSLWHPSPCPDHIAIVGEWDTPYGQTLLRTMDKAFASDNQILTFSYLRGLDGQLPDVAADAGKVSDTSSSDDSGKSRSDAASGTTAKQLERPDGQGQFDYLRRLADRISRRDEELRGAGMGRIAAVGVLGSDPYDKLLVLQALRPVLPEAVFFTTDLDARFSSPGERRTTRNLVIASGFGLELRPAVQGHIPPFRDTYQTAAFLATRLAVHDSEDGAAAAAPDISGWLKPPRVFEIGRTAAFAFPASNEGNAVGDDGDKCRTDVLQCRRIYPASDRIAPGFSSGQPPYGTMFLAGLLLAALAFAADGFTNGLGRPATGSDAQDWSRGWRRWTIVGGTAFLLGAALCFSWNSLAVLLTGGNGGEPMALTEGISLWPTILLRACSFLIGIALIFRSFRRLDENIDDIARQLRLEALRSQIETEDRRGRRGFGEALRDIFSPRLVPKAASDDEHDIAAFWRIYVRRGRRGARTCRVVVCLALVFGLWSVLSAIFGQPNVPARGNAVRAVYMVVTMLDVAVTWFLIFLVADATLSSCLFVRALRGVRSVWPWPSRIAFAALLGLEGRAVDEWIDTRFVAMRTRCIIDLIYFPFILVALLIVSRSAAFDSFAANPTLLITQGISLVLLAGCVIWLRFEAEEARKTAHLNLTNALIEVRSAAADAAEGPSRGLDQEAADARHKARQQWPDRIKELISQVDALQEGAFTPISHQPFVRALLLPLGTFGGTKLLDYLSIAGL